MKNSKFLIVFFLGLFSFCMFFSSCQKEGSPLNEVESLTTGNTNEAPDTKMSELLAYLNELGEAGDYALAAPIAYTEEAEIAHFFDLERLKNLSTLELDRIVEHSKILSFVLAEEATELLSELPKGTLLDASFVETDMPAKLQQQYQEFEWNGYTPQTLKSVWCTSWTTTSDHSWCSQCGGCGNPHCTFMKGRIMRQVHKVRTCYVNQGGTYYSYTQGNTTTTGSNCNTCAF